MNSVTWALLFVAIALPVAFTVRVVRLSRAGRLDRTKAGLVFSGMLLIIASAVFVTFATPVVRALVPPLVILVAGIALAVTKDPATRVGPLTFRTLGLIAMLGACVWLLRGLLVLM